MSDMTNGKAIASLVLGIFSILSAILVSIGLILGVVGLILGILGLQEIKRLEQKGKNIAIAGIVCSSIGALLPILAVIFAYTAYLNYTNY
ncbi:DUF4190 domain-containing protein [Heliorestis acidaminivorans]|uniref:DUF4190 domain-containing protein n=1 Tax=Heliorestis acidaminivorans TaxID=553427 RepID=A0A6I0ENW3_9FIRM|nr:DUF4190 domain-containing protein [Heliorestis acidaminivorans]KAB2951511.1 DUF4190 domain-containing protein [Heliorestis acidaminivorans]